MASDPVDPVSFVILGSRDARGEHRRSRAADLARGGGQGALEPVRHSLGLSVQARPRTPARDRDPVDSARALNGAWPKCAEAVRTPLATPVNRDEATPCTRWRSARSLHLPRRAGPKGAGVDTMDRPPGSACQFGGGRVRDRRAVTAARSAGVPDPMPQSTRGGRRTRVPPQWGLEGTALRR